MLKRYKLILKIYKYICYTKIYRFRFEHIYINVIIWKRWWLIIRMMCIAKTLRLQFTLIEKHCSEYVIVLWHIFSLLDWMNNLYNKILPFSIFLWINKNPDFYLVVHSLIDFLLVKQFYYYLFAIDHFLK